MAPKAAAPAAAAPKDDDGLPSDSDDEDEAGTAPLLDKNLPASDAAPATPAAPVVPPVPIAAAATAAAAPPPAAAGAPSTAPLLSPRDKLIQKSKETPLTPRSQAKALEDAADAAIEDPAAAAAAAKKALEENLDPAAAKVLAEAEAAAELIKNDPKAAAKAAYEAAKNIKPPTVEELMASKKAYEDEAKKVQEAAKKLWEEMINDRPPPCCPMEEIGPKWTAYIDLLLEQIPDGKLPPSLPPEKLKEYVMLFLKVCAASSGWVMFCVRWVLRIWNMLPFNVAQMVFGAALCYFGGTFTTSIAAAEAFRTMGYERAKADVDALMVELKPFFEANSADDEVDDDGDGISDVDQLTPPELLQRKAFIAITTIKQPDRIQSAIGSIYAALLAVLATLKLEFAATTAMAMGVADMVKKPLIRFCDPPLQKILPPAAHQWIVPSIDSVVRIIAISAAWYLQQIISAFYSALRGGKLFAEGLFNILTEKAKVGIILCPGMVGADYDPDDSILDDAIGWIIAAQGFMFQFNTGFTLPFPFNLILAPLSIFEWYLRFQISSEPAPSRRSMSTDFAYDASSVDSWCAPVAWNATASCSPTSGVCWCHLNFDSALSPGLQCSA